MLVISSVAVISWNRSAWMKSPMHLKRSKIYAVLTLKPLILNSTDTKKCLALVFFINAKFFLRLHVLMFHIMLVGIVLYML